MNLSGFSAVYPGYSAQESATATTETNQAAAKEAANKLLGAQVLGRALTGAQPPPAPNPGQPLAPNPGQASVPNAPPAQAQPPVPAPQAPPAAGPVGAPVAQGGGGMPEISLQALTQRILQTTPQVQGHPEILMAALERAAPLLDRQSKEDLMELRKQMATERLTQAGEIARARQQGLEAWRGAQGARADRRADQRDDAQESLETYRKRTGDQREAEEIGRNGRFQAGEEGKNTRSQATEAGRNQRFDTREARLAASTAVRQDQGYQRLQLQAQALAERAQATGDKKALGEWRATVDAMHKRATEIIQSNSVNSNLSKADKDALLAEQRQGYETAISGMRVRMGTSTPTGGATAPGAPAAPKVQGQVPQNAPLVTGGAAAADAPPLAMLKPNTVTTFANGQKWTVGPDGQPKKVD